ncbi:MAG TPA: hypothetical protein VK760_07870 [Candidatus Acidoferrales bacterium]|nr:hypothetical protein [Candidatus Acidoferrales bacterium]
MKRIAAVAGFLLAGCAATSLPAARVDTPLQKNGGKPQTAYSVTFALDSTPATTAAGRRVRKLRFAYLNGTSSSTIALGAGGCTVCTTKLRVPGSVDVFSVDAYDGSGKRMSRTWLNPYLGGFPEVDVTLSSTLTDVELSPSVSQPAFGTPATIQIYVSALNEESGMEYIVGPGAYSQPIVVRSSNQVTGMGNASTVLRSPADNIPALHYDGGYASAMILARSAGSTGTAIVTPLLPSTNVAIPHERMYGLTPSGNALWASNAGNLLFRITADKPVARVSLPPGVASPGSLAAAADGTLYFGACFTPRGRPRTTGIGYIAPNGSSGIFSTPSNACDAISIDPGGDLWFVTDVLNRMTPAGKISQPRWPHQPYGYPMIFARDGTIWTIDGGGVLQQFSRNGTLLGSHGKGYFTVVAGGPKRIVAFTRSAAVAYDLHGNATGVYTGAVPYYDQAEFDGPAVAPDGAVWFSIAEQDDTLLIGRLGTNGTLSEMVVPIAISEPDASLAVTQDNGLWIYQDGAYKILRVQLPH